MDKDNLMLKLKNINDLIRLAIKREQESFDMYLSLAKKIDDTQIANLLRNRAMEEFEHKQILEFELIKLGRAIPSTKIDIDDTILKNFNKDSDTITGVEFEDILALSVHKEDSAFRFYFNLAHKYPDKEMQDVFISLAEQEMKHKLMAEIELNQYLASGEYKKCNWNDNS